MKKMGRRNRREKHKARNVHNRLSNYFVTLGGYQ